MQWIIPLRINTQAYEQMAKRSHQGRDQHAGKYHKMMLVLQAPMLQKSYYRVSNKGGKNFTNKYRDAVEIFLKDVHNSTYFYGIDNAMWKSGCRTNNLEQEKHVSVENLVINPFYEKLIW